MGGFKVPNPVKVAKKARDEFRRVAPDRIGVPTDLGRDIRREAERFYIEQTLKKKGLEIIDSGDGQKTTRKLKPGETLDFTYKYQGGLGSWVRRTKFRM